MYVMYIHIHGMKIVLYSNFLFSPFYATQSVYMRKWRRSKSKLFIFIYRGAFLFRKKNIKHPKLKTEVKPKFCPVNRVNNKRIRVIFYKKKLCFKNLYILLRKIFNIWWYKFSFRWWMIFIYTNEVKLRFSIEFYSSSNFFYICLLLVHRFFFMCDTHIAECENCKEKLSFFSWVIQSWKGRFLLHAA